jgi:hypothetical protein
VPNVYSKMLTAVASSGVGTVGIGTPPAGHKWIIKDICATLGGGKAFPRLGFRLIDSFAVTIMEVTQPFAVTGVTFRWEGSQVVEYGTGLNLTTAEAGWSLRVSGYELVLP